MWSSSREVVIFREVDNRREMRSANRVGLARAGTTQSMLAVVSDTNDSESRYAKLLSHFHALIHYARVVCTICVYIHV